MKRNITMAQETIINGNQIYSVTFKVWMLIMKIRSNYAYTYVCEFLQDINKMIPVWTTIPTTLFHRVTQTLVYQFVPLYWVHELCALLQMVTVMPVKLLLYVEV